MNSLEKDRKIAALMDHLNVPKREELIRRAILCEPSPGICIMTGCETVQPVRRDEAGAICEHCKTDTVQSVLVIAGLV